MTEEKDKDKINALAILSYIGILFLVPLLVAKDDDFAQFHAKQGMVLFILIVVGMVFIIIPFIGSLVMLIGLIFAIIGIMNVINNEKKELPIIGKYADKFKI
ncbi:MAG: hypothetical protein ACQEP6_01660 [Patescibacteria group bacterium]